MYAHPSRPSFSLHVPLFPLCRSADAGSYPLSVMDDKSESLRWFLYPQEALYFLQRSAEDTATAADTRFAAPYMVPENAAGTASCPCTSPPEPNGNVEPVDAEGAVVSTPKAQPRAESQLAALREKIASLEAELRALRAAPASAPAAGTGTPAAAASPPPPSAACPLRVKKPRGRNKQRGVDDGPRFHMPPKNLLAPTLKALSQFDMIHDGDRLLIGVSGGKDSLSLLHVMKQVQYVYRAKGIHFEFGAATVDPGTEAYDPSPLKQ